MTQNSFFFMSGQTLKQLSLEFLTSMKKHQLVAFTKKHKLMPLSMLMPIPLSKTVSRAEGLLE